MTTLCPGFFESNEYLVDENVQFVQFENAYSIYDNYGLQVGNVIQRIPAWQKALRLFFNKSIFPFTLDIIDGYENVIVSIRRNWTFWMSNISIFDGEGCLIGQVRQRFQFLKPLFRIYDENGKLSGQITGDWRAWNFQITDTNGQVIGHINKKWAGLLKEAFTTADKYYVSLEPDYAEDNNKVNIVSTAIVIDLILKESK